MDEASKIALFTGFGGVIIGGAITYLSESHFRHQEKKAIDRKNFILSLCEVGRLLDELTSIYNSITGTLPETCPTLISSQIRSFAASSIIPSSLETETLLSLEHKKGAVFSDVSLFIRRSNSIFNTLQFCNEFKVKADNLLLKKGFSTPTSHEDVSRINLPMDDAQVIMNIVKLENLYRDFFRQLIAEIKTGREIIKRLNKNSERKFKKIFRKKHPKLTLAQSFEPLEYLQGMPHFSIRDLYPSIVS